MNWFRKKIIFGCESRGDGDSPYLTRYTLLSLFGCAIYVHVFHRSDHDTLHDHPWPFVTCILWRGYVEEMPGKRRRLWPGMVQFRPAKHVHRVELIGRRPAVTLVFRGRYVREWGFHTKMGWQLWRDYFRDLGC